MAVIPTVNFGEDNQSFIIMVKITSNLMFSLLTTLGCAFYPGFLLQRLIENHDKVCRNEQKAPKQCSII
jgi:hypothetical protein